MQVQPVCTAPDAQVARGVARDGVGLPPEVGAGDGGGVLHEHTHFALAVQIEDPGESKELQWGGLTGEAQVGAYLICSSTPAVMRVDSLDLSMAQVFTQPECALKANDIISVRGSSGTCRHPTRFPSYVPITIMLKVSLAFHENHRTFSAV